jgi:hypothetical protein
MYHMAHSRKRIRKLSIARFRGSKLEYSFDVFPISPWLTDSASVFIFSRRLLDKNGRAHHVVSCLGETASTVSEIRRHRRARCVRDNEANVVCILKKADRAERLTVINDIAAARSFSCIRGKFKPNACKPKAKVLPFKSKRPDDSKKTKSDKRPLSGGVDDKAGNYHVYRTKKTVARKAGKTRADRRRRAA